MLKRTPLFSAHQRLGARLVEFGGWEMPVQYSSIVEEHHAVRRAGGLFDISHMGEILVTGPGAEAFLNHTLTNDVQKLTPGQGQYTLLCNERGGVVDDLYAYRLEADEFLLVVNASRTNADWEWLQTRFDQCQTRDGFQLKNASDQFGALAVQGPRVKEFIASVVTGGSLRGALVGQVTELKKNQAGAFLFQGFTLWVARTGYTGEDGFEVLAPADATEEIWNRLLEVGQAHGLRPAGLGARDTLRTEMGYPLYGHELDEHITPIEAGVGFFVSLNKGEFVGRAALAAQKARGVDRKCVAFKLAERLPPPRPHYPIWSCGSRGAQVGEVVSGTQSPSLGVGIGMGYVPPALAQPGTPLEIEIRGRRAPATVVAKPIYRRA